MGGVGYEVNPFGGDDEKYTTQAKEVSRAMGSAWINFVTSLDPNGPAGSPNDTVWPEYRSLSGIGKGLVFDLGKIYVEDDDWREEGIAWFIEHALSVFGN
jgi:carboxylesterase type B